MQFELNMKITLQELNIDIFLQNDCWGFWINNEKQKLLLHLKKIMLTIFPSEPHFRIDNVPNVTFFIGFFLWWTIDIILVKYFGMEQTVKSTQYFQNKQLALKMTHRIDSNNEYRIQVRSSMQFTKMIFNLTLLILACSQPYRWYIQHFIEFNVDTMNNSLYHHQIYLVLSYYYWETAMLRQYWFVNTSVSIHHWFTLIAATMCVLGIYSPYATFYAMTTLAFGAPLWFTMGFRFQYSSKYPQITRKLCKYTKIYFILMSIVNIGGQIALMINGLFIVKQSSVLTVIIMIFAITGWFYDDILLLRAYDTYSKQIYENIKQDLQKTNWLKSKGFDEINLTIDELVNMNESQLKIILDELNVNKINQIRITNKIQNIGVSTNVNVELQQTIKRKTDQIADGALTNNTNYENEGELNESNFDIHEMGLILDEIHVNDENDDENNDDKITSSSLSILKKLKQKKQI
eukprot:381579_1